MGMDLFLTESQKEVLNAVKAHKFSGRPLPTEILGVSSSTINSTMTYIFNNFVEALDLLSDPEVAALFERRLRKKHKEIWESTRVIRAAVLPFRRGE